MQPIFWSLFSSQEAVILSVDVSAVLLNCSTHTLECSNDILLDNHEHIGNKIFSLVCIKCGLQEQEY